MPLAPERALTRTRSRSSRSKASILLRDFEESSSEGCDFLKKSLNFLSGESSFGYSHRVSLTANSSGGEFESPSREGKTNQSSWAGIDIEDGICTCETRHVFGERASKQAERNRVKQASRKQTSTKSRLFIDEMRERERELLHASFSAVFHSV